MPDQERINRKLRNYLGFYEDDLVANRVGQLSRRQRRRIVFYTNLKLAVVSSAEIALVLVLLFSPLALEAVLAFVIGIFIILIGMYVIFKWGRRDADPSAVDILEGPAELVVKAVQLDQELTSSNAYYLKIEGQSFDVSKLVANCIVDGHIYRVHVMRHRREILSAEFVR